MTQELRDKDELVLLRNLGINYGNIGQREMSMEYLHKALKAAQELGVKSTEYLISSDIERTNQKIGESENVFVYNKKAERSPKY